MGLVVTAGAADAVGGRVATVIAGGMIAAGGEAGTVGVAVAVGAVEVVVGIDGSPITTEDAGSVKTAGGGVVGVGMGSDGSLFDGWVTTDTGSAKAAGIVALVPRWLRTSLRSVRSMVGAAVKVTGGPGGSGCRGC